MAGQYIHRFLIVDGDLIDGMLMTEVLTEAGYAVDRVANGAEVLRKLNSNAYDLIISNLTLYDMGAIDLFKIISKDYPALNQRFLFLADRLTSADEAFLNEHGYPYIQKPFKMLDLLDQIYKVLEQIGEAASYESVDENANRRSDERFHWSAYCNIYEDGRYDSMPLTAKTRDISNNGIKIRYVGRPLHRGSVVDVHIVSLNLKAAAVVVWSNAINKLDTFSGMKFIQPIPIQNIADAARQ